jgi:hypothetical protein
MDNKNLPWEIKLLDFSNRKTIGITTIASTNTKREACKYLVGYKNILKIGRTYLVEKGGK